MRTPAVMRYFEKQSPQPGSGALAYYPTECGEAASDLAQKFRIFNHPPPSKMMH